MMNDKVVYFSLKKKRADSFYDYVSKNGNDNFEFVEVGEKAIVAQDMMIEDGSIGDDDVMITEDNARYTRIVRTFEMIDFSRLNFNKAMMLEENVKNYLKSNSRLSQTNYLIRL